MTILDQARSINSEKSMKVAISGPRGKTRLRKLQRSYIDALMGDTELSNTLVVAMFGAQEKAVIKLKKSHSPKDVLSSCLCFHRQGKQR